MFIKCPTLCTILSVFPNYSVNFNSLNAATNGQLITLIELKMKSVLGPML
jgi:hypothetical protein